MIVALVPPSRTRSESVGAQLYVTVTGPLSGVPTADPCRDAQAVSNTTALVTRAVRSMTNSIRDCMKNSISAVHRAHLSIH